MLHEIVTQALSRLPDAPAQNASRPIPFRYAYASEDGQYVAILGQDRATYVVDLKQDRFCREFAGAPCGFSGHVLEMELEDRAASPSAHVRHFDLDLDRDSLDWRHCTRLT